MSFDWKLDGKCVNWDVNLFFDTYEENPAVARQVDKLCYGCPIVKRCYGEGRFNNEWGVWGGVYWDGKGAHHKEFISHKTQEDWTELKFALSVDWEEEV